MNAQAQLSAAQQLAASGAGSTASLENSVVGKGDDDEVPELEAPEEDGPVDETGVDAKDIELVMAQVNCSRAKAVRVLKESGGDLINASAYYVFRRILHTLTVFSHSHGGKRVIPFAYYTPVRNGFVDMPSYSLGEVSQSHHPPTVCCQICHVIFAISATRHNNLIAPSHSRQPRSPQYDQPLRPGSCVGGEGQPSVLSPG